MGLPLDRLSHKQEKFCEYYSQGLSPIESALKSGYKQTTAGVIASENLNKPKIKARIAELMKPVQDAITESLLITKESQLKDLEDVKQKALKDNQLRTAISAITEQNKMLGFYEPEKKELKITDMPDYKIVIGGVIESD